MMLLLYVFASFGLAYVFGHAKITFPLRMWLDSIARTTRGDQFYYSAGARFAASWFLALLECPACLAFWLGAASVFTPIVDMLPIPSIPLGLLAAGLGLANTGAVLTLGMITGLIQTE